MRSDVELLDAWRGGEKLAGEELFERHFDSIYRFFASKVANDVQDLVQQTFLACVENELRLQDSERFRAFLFGIARNQLLRYFRNKKRDGRIDFGVTSVEDMGPSPSSALGDKREQRLLLKALRSIPIDLQIAVELHYWEGMSGPALSQALDIPEGTVRSRLRRALEALRARLKELADSQDLLESTSDALEHWAASLKELLAPKSA